ncbi:MAG: hypothetical protein ABIR79_11575 [Candidatus Binatia bacterium]
MSARAAGVGLALGFVAMVALRLLLIHVSLSEILNWEEPYRLTIADAVIAGPRWSLADYQADAYQGGSLAMGILAAPLVAVFGSSYETLKLVPLAFTLLTAAGWALLLWRWVSPAAAALATWLFALAPPMAQIYQVHAMGSHAETALFTVAGFVLTMALLHPSATPVRVRVGTFALGAVAGLGLWYCYSAASGIAAWGLVGLGMAPKGRVRRSFVPLLTGAAIGFTPWLVQNLRSGFSGLERVVELFGPRGSDLLPPVEPLVVRAAALVGVDLVRALGFAETVPGVPEWPAWTLYLLGVVLVSLLAVLARGVSTVDRAEPLVARLIVLTIAVHLGAYLASSFRCDVENGFIAHRFFSPLFPLVAAGAAIVLTRPSRGWPQRAAGVGMVFVLGLGALGTAELLRERPSRPIPLPTQSDALMGQAMLLKHRHDPARGLVLIAALDEPQRTRVYFGFGWGLEFRYEKDGDWERLARVLDGAQPDERRAVLSGIRWAVRTREGQVRDYANAEFFGEYSRALHSRIVELAARLNARDQPSASAFGG